MNVAGNGTLKNPTELFEAAQLATNVAVQQRMLESYASFDSERKAEALEALKTQESPRLKKLAEIYAAQMRN